MPECILRDAFLVKQRFCSQEPNLKNPTAIHVDRRGIPSFFSVSRSPVLPDVFRSLNQEIILLGTRNLQTGDIPSVFHNPGMRGLMRN